MAKHTQEQSLEQFAQDTEQTQDATLTPETEAEAEKPQSEAEQSQESTQERLQREIAEMRQAYAKAVLDGANTEEVSSWNASLVSKTRELELEQTRLARQPWRIDVWSSVTEAIRKANAKHSLHPTRIMVELEAGDDDTFNGRVLSDEEIGSTKPKAKGAASKGTGVGKGGKATKWQAPDGTEYGASAILHREYAKLPKAMQDKVDYADANPGSRTWARYLSDAQEQGYLKEYIRA